MTVLKNGKQSCIVRSGPFFHITYVRSWQKGHPLALAWPVAWPSARSGPRASHHLEHLQPVHHFAQKGRRDCMVCSDRQGGTRYLTHYRCGTCPDNPALYVDTFQSLPHPAEVSLLTSITLLHNGTCLSTLPRHPSPPNTL